MRHRRPSAGRRLGREPDHAPTQAMRRETRREICAPRETDYTGVRGSRRCPNACPAADAFPFRSFPPRSGTGWSTVGTAPRPSVRPDRARGERSFADEPSRIESDGPGDVRRDDRTGRTLDGGGDTGPRRSERRRRKRSPKNRDARRREEVPAGARYTDPSREEKLVRSAGRREGGVAIRPDGMALGKAQIRVTPTRTISGGEPVRIRTRGASVTSITAWKIGQFLCPNKPFVRMSIMQKCMARN